MLSASRSVSIMVALALLCGSMASAQADDRGGVTTPFYTSFPTAGGPYITAATWDPNADGGNGALRIIFNEDLDAGSVSPEDFTSFGFDWGPNGPGIWVEAIPSAEHPRVVTLTNFASGSLPAATDSIALATLQESGDLVGIVGADGHSSGDRTRVPITTGPALVAVEISQWAENNGDADNDEILLVFDAPIAAPTGGWDDADFALTPELQPINPGVPSVEFDFTLGSGPLANQLTLTRAAMSGPDDPHFRQIWPGIAKFRLDAEAVVWEGTSIANELQVIMTVNTGAGPILLAAQWNDICEELWLVFNEPIDPASLENDPEYQYILDGGGAWGIAQSQALASPADYSNVVRIQVFDGLLGVPGTTIQVAAGHELQDHQGEMGPQTTPVPIVTGIGILRSSYEDGGTPGNPMDDVLDVWFSETFADLMAVDGTDFTFDNPDLDDALWDDVTVAASNASGFGHARVTGWDEVLQFWGMRLPVGPQLSLRSNTDIQGAQTLSIANAHLRARVSEDRTVWPMNGLQEVTSLPRQYHDFQLGVDRAYLAWREAGFSDPSDSYLLFCTNEGSGMFTQAMIDNYKSNAIPVSNRRGELIDGGINRVSVDITAGTQTTTGAVLMEGDAVWFMLVPVTYHGSLAPVASALVFTEALAVGGICPPSDFHADLDDDLIHVVGTQVGPPQGRILMVYGDSHSAPCGDNLYVFDGPDPFSANVLGSGPIMVDGSFGPLMLAPEANELPTLYPSAEYLGDFSQTTPIINDIVPPTIAIAAEDLVHPDRFNPFRMYKKDDYINILVRAYDGATGYPEALSDLLNVWADFSEIDERILIPPELGGFYVDSIPFVSLGYDQRDNDGDWDDTSPNTSNGNGVMDFPEPYCDENGDGYFTPGETFLDADSDGMCDAPHGPGGAGDPWHAEYDWYLDCTDPDEHGWYEIQLLTDVPYWDEHAHSNVDKGFCIADPVTDPAGLQGPPVAHNLPVGMGVHDGDLDVVTAYTTSDSILFRCKLDEQAPSIAHITELYSLAGYTEPSDPGQNLMIAPGDSSTYVLGPERYMNFAIQTPSDEDVLFLVTEIFQDRVGAWAWEPLVLDPPGINGDPAAPGLGGFDDDRDVIGQGLLTNGVDDDEDGTIDELDEGIDFSDPEIVDAVQDSIADAQAAGGDGIHRLNDHRDNDNDAFYVFEPYFDGDPGTIEEVSQRLRWFNIDESTDNSLDDDYDGTVDESDEIEFYNSLIDDNEDGIMDGEAAAIAIDGLRSEYSYPGYYWRSPTGTFYVDAARILGQHAVDFDGDIRALTEFISPAYDVIDPNGILTQPFPGLGWGDSTAHESFEWFAGHNDTNIDLVHIAGLYNMVVDGSVQYRLRGVAYDQVGNANSEGAVPLTFTIQTDVSAVEDPSPAVAPTYPLQTSCASPFVPGGRVSYSTPTRGDVTLSVVDVQGRRVATLCNGVLPAGAHEVAWDGRGERGTRLAAGVYFMRLEAQGARAQQKLILIR